MNLRRNVKVALQSSGLYPVARAIKRRFDTSVKQVRRAETSLYRQFIRPNDLVFDVGVNVGQKSEIFLALGARVVGVEPNPNCRKAIDFQFAGNPNFTLVQKALGAEPGTATLHFVGSDATASLRADWAYLSVDGSTVQQRPTEVTTLAALIAEHGVPALCKIDVEGFELEVLKGLDRPLPLVTFEYHLSERDLLGACLHRLAELGPIEVNANTMDSGDLTFPRWLSVVEFLAADIPAEADCWVRVTG